MPPARWQLRLLGGFELSDGRQRLTRLHSRAAMALLARLAMPPARAHGREELAELLWPQAPGERGRARLRQTLSTLKALLEAEGTAPVIEADRRTLRLVPGSVACDVAAVEQAARHHDGDALQRLVAGELMPGFYDDWIVQERLRLQAMAERIALRAAEGAAEGTVQHAAPDLAPPAPRPELSSTLPRFLDHLVGADAALQALLPRVTAHRLVTLFGPGGAGKTRLAAEAAASLAADPSGAAAGAVGSDLPGLAGERPAAPPPFALVGFVALADCTDAAGVGDRLLLALGHRGAGEPLQVLAQLLAGQRALLVLDNLEQLQADARGLVAALLARLPLLHVLATSRQPLGLHGEQLQALAPLALPASDDLASVRASDAARLFAQRARTSRPDFGIHEGNAADVAALVRRLEGWPLAIELAAARVRELPPQRLLQALDPGVGAGRWSALDRRSGRAPARQASLAGLLDWSLAQLAPSQLAVLHWLAHGPSTVSPALLARSAAAADAQSPARRWADAAEARWLLDSLQMAGLARQTSGADDRLWCTLPEPVSDHVRQAVPQAAALAARSAWRAGFRAWAEGLGATVPLPEFQSTLPGLMWALHSAQADGQAAELVRLVLALAPAWAERSLPAGGLAALSRALAALEAAPGPLGPVEHRRLLACGHALAARLALEGQRERALVHADAAAANWPDDPGERSVARLHVARVRWRAQGWVAEARSLIDQALADARAAPDPGACAAALTLQATMANEVDADAARADALYAQALEQWHGLPEGQRNEHARRGLRYNRAITAIYAGRAAQALPQLAEIEAEARAAGDRHLLSQVLDARGSALDQLGRVAEALQASQAALREAWDSVEPGNVVFSLWNLAPLLLAASDARRALVLMTFARAFWKRHYGALSPADAREAQALCRRAAARLGASAARRARIEADGLDLAGAVALAAHEETPGRPKFPHPPRGA